MTNLIKQKQKLLRFRVLGDFTIQTGDDYWISKEAGQTFGSAPQCLTDFLEDKGLISRNIAAKFDNNASEVDLGRPFTEEELCFDGLGNLRIATACTVAWKWLDEQGRYDGAGRLDSRQSVWVPEKIAKDILKADAGVLRAYPKSPDPRMKNHDGFVQLGSYQR